VRFNAWKVRFNASDRQKRVKQLLLLDSFF
jgi:hypothetical protein